MSGVERIELGSVAPGECFGEDEFLLTLTERKSSAVAKADCELVAFERTSLCAGNALFKPVHEYLTQLQKNRVQEANALRDFLNRW
jgi:CRP-like cAMP-binding protein